MKKLILSLSIVTVAMLTFYSCKKKDVIPTNTFNTNSEIQSNKTSIQLNPSILLFTNEGRFLDFKTRAQYDAVISNTSEETENSVKSYLQQINHTSWLQFTLNSSNINLQEMVPDEFFASLLSDDRTIKIGEYIFKINPQDEKVLALHESNLDQYALGI